MAGQVLTIHNVRPTMKRLDTRPGRAVKYHVHGWRNLLRNWDRAGSLLRRYAAENRARREISRDHGQPIG